MGLLINHSFEIVIAVFADLIRRVELMKWQVQNLLLRAASSYQAYLNPHYICEPVLPGRRPSRLSIVEGAR